MSRRRAKLGRTAFRFIAAWHKAFMAVREEMGCGKRFVKIGKRADKQKRKKTQQQKEEQELLQKTVLRPKTRQIQ